MAIQLSIASTRYSTYSQTGSFGTGLALTLSTIHFDFLFNG